jgi:hypothetical protein
MCPNGHAVAGCKKHYMEHKLLEFFDPIISHGFKSIVACVLVGEIGMKLLYRAGRGKLKGDTTVWSASHFWINARRATTSASSFAIKCEMRH